MNNLQDTSNYSINKVYGTMVKGVFYTTLLVLGNSSSIVNLNNIHTDQQIVSESQKNNIYKTFTSSASMSYELPGYTFNNMITNVERISMDKEKISNIEKLEQIAKLEDDWDGDGAKAFSKVLIAKDMQKFFSGNIISVTVAQCRETNAVVKYLPTERSIYHSEIHSSNEKVVLTESQAKYLANLAIIEYKEQ